MFSNGHILDGMGKILLYIIVILALAFGGWYWYVSQGNGGAGLNADLYPLYPGATWGEVKAKTTADGTGYEVVSEPFTNVTNIAEKSTPFAKYYDDKLTGAGWAQDMMREAGGPGAEVSYYTKGDQFIVVSFHSVFNTKHPDAPSECPCDVQLSLMSGTQVGSTPGDVLSARTYHDAALGFSIILPTAIATSTSDSFWSVDPTYAYSAKGPDEAIAGVKFTIPTSIATGTNLSSDSYLSVEHLPSGKSCDAATFLVAPYATSHSLTEGIVTYSVASSTDAAAGNRYDEWVYARSDSNPCIAVRYFIHYAAIGNFPPGTVKEFDEAALLSEFDQIRRTLGISK